MEFHRLIWFHGIIDIAYALNKLIMCYHFFWPFLKKGMIENEDNSYITIEYITILSQFMSKTNVCEIMELHICFQVRKDWIFLVLSVYVFLTQTCANTEASTETSDNVNAILLYGPKSRKTNKMIYCCFNTANWTTFWMNFIIPHTYFAFKMFSFSVST